jgi:hypothetical protein
MVSDLSLDKHKLNDVIKNNLQPIQKKIIEGHLIEQHRISTRCGFEVYKFRLRLASLKILACNLDQREQTLHMTQFLAFFQLMIQSYLKELYKIYAP